MSGGPGAAAVKELLGVAEAAGADAEQVHAEGQSFAHAWTNLAHAFTPPALPGLPLVSVPAFIGFGATDPEEHAREMGQ